MSPRVPADDARSARSAGVRVDKWLWVARAYKTRSLAVAAIEAGQVRVGGERVKPARAVKPGDRIEIRKSGLAWTLDVLGVAERRGPASEAAKLYREDDASREARELELARRRATFAERTPGRPTKRDRRALEDFLNEP